VARAARRRRWAGKAPADGVAGEDGRTSTHPAQLPLARIRPDLLYAWRGSSLVIAAPDGSLGRDPSAGFAADLTGWYFRQTRFLSRLALTLAGEPPYFCSSAEAAPHLLELAYVYPPVVKGGGGGSGSGASGERQGLLFRDLDVRLDLRVHPASLDVLLRITSRWQDDVRLDVAWALAADFATIDEAHFGYREEEVPVAAGAAPTGAVFRSGHPELPLVTQVIAEAHGASEGGDGDGAGGTTPEWRWEAGRLHGSVVLRRQRTAEVRLHVRAIDRSDPVDAEGERRREARVRAWRGGVVKVHAPGEPPLVEITERALDDLASLALLEGPEDEWLTLGAGVPLYQALWGRDALTAGWQAAVFDRAELLGDALTRLGRLQGRAFDAERDEEPGRILNQGKMDPLSRLTGRPFARSYADYASPFDFVIGLGHRWALVGTREVVEPHFGAALAVLDWARKRGDADGDGYLEYLTRSPHGPTHQGWKDSENAVVDERGRQVPPPIAPCEVQGYWYASLQIMSVLSGVIGDAEAARALWQEADALKERFNRDFWMEREGFVAFGLDAGKGPIRALTSNAGQCLATGIVSDEHVPRLVRRMFEPDLFSGWGVRTLSSRNPAYNPLDYHLGSVWPVENGTILFGLKRYGLSERVEQLARALYDLARLWPGGRAPECVGGYARSEYAHPGVYPRANAPQAWNQSVLPILLQSLLGLVPFAPLHLLLVDPMLPAWLPELTVRNLRVGEATVALRFRRDARGRSHHEVLERSGKLKVVRQAWIQSFSTDVWDRLADAYATIRA
jgi:glycogen debranching enzyme